MKGKLTKTGNLKVSHAIEADITSRAKKKG